MEWPSAPTARPRLDTAPGGVVLWDIDLKSWQQIAGRIANRNFTREEWRQFVPDLPYHQTFDSLPIPPDSDPTGATPPPARRGRTRTEPGELLNAQTR